MHFLLYQKNQITPSSPQQFSRNVSFNKNWQLPGNTGFNFQTHTFTSLCNNKTYWYDKPFVFQQRRLLLTQVLTDHDLTSPLTPLFPALQGFPGGSEVKGSACNAGDLGLIPGLGRSPGEGNGTPLQYSCLENPMVGGDWWATLVHGVTKSRTRLTTSLSFFFLSLCST